MAQRSGAAASAKSRARKVVGPKAIGRLEKSLDAADLALKDLRKELGRGGSSAIKDLTKTLGDSRKNLRSASRTILRDLEKVQKAATKGQAPKRTASARAGTTAKASTTRRSGTTAKAGTSRRTATAAAKKTGAKKTTARSSGTRRAAAGTRRATRSK